MNEVEVEKVYLVVHEFFGVSMGTHQWTLVTPEISSGAPSGHHTRQAGGDGHEYMLARFRGGSWVGGKTQMSKGSTYKLEGVTGGYASPLQDFSPCAQGTFPLKEDGGYCRWIVPCPRRIHQLRLVDIGESRPLFSGKAGSEVEAELEAASLVQVFEYVPNAERIQVIETPLRGKPVPVKLDYDVDQVTRTINLHIWASLGRDSHDNDSDAIDHAKYVFGQLTDHFSGLDMKAESAVAIDAAHTYQRPMPKGLRFTELLTLAEENRFRTSEDGFVTILCTPRTCGVAGSLFVGNGQ